MYKPDYYYQIFSIITLTVKGHLVGGSYHVNGALWSLVFEIRFYVYALLFTLLLKGRYLTKSLSFIFLIAYTYLIKLQIGSNIQFISFCCFFIGSMSYLFRETLSKIPYLTLISIIITLLVIGYVCHWENITHQLRANISFIGKWMWINLPIAIFFSLIIINIKK